MWPCLRGSLGTESPFMPLTIPVLARVEHDRGAADRGHDESEGFAHLVSGDSGDGEALHHRCQDDARLRQAEGVADALVNARAEWEIGAVGDAADARGTEPRRVEAFRIGEEALVAVRDVHREYDAGALGYRITAELDVSFRHTVADPHDR